VARAEFATGDSLGQLLPRLVEWFSDQQRRHGNIAAIGIASFGPIDLRIESPTYGHITSTPKSSWANTDLIAPFLRSFGNIPIGFDTDVNGAALGEFYWGAATGLTDFVYITIGTGIGAGAMVGGQLLHGMMHPEMGHMRLPRIARDEFPGVCPFHGDCWEGLCSGPAILKRNGTPAEHLPADHPTWQFETHYIALALCNIICTLSPQRIILGGSIPKAGGTTADNHNFFFQQVRHEVQAILNGYIASPALQTDGIRDYVVAPQLGSDAGVWGAIALGQCTLGLPFDLDNR
jgi:fructokinase